MTVSFSEFGVSDTASLNNAIAQANAAFSGTFVIDLLNNITLNAALLPIVTVPGNLTINGAGHTLSGNDTFRGLFVYAGAVTVENLQISHAIARGGNGESGGGGAAGLGGGLFVADDVAHGAASPGNVTLINVGFDHDQAIGGNVVLTDAGAGGGGGMGGSATDIRDGVPGAQGGLGIGPNRFGEGATSPEGGDGGAVPGPAGFGGGGYAPGETASAEENGGYGGGGGGGEIDGRNGTGGFGAGDGSEDGGGGGLGAGGDIFVEQGAGLTIVGGTMDDGQAFGGVGGGGPFEGRGHAYGGGIFMQGFGAVHLGTGSVAGQVTTVNGEIADETGASGQNAGQSTVFIEGAGTVVLSMANPFTNSAVLNNQATSGTLDLSAVGAAGGAVQFRGPATLRLENAAFSARRFGTTIIAFGYADVIDIPGLPFAAGAQAQYTASTHTLVVSSGGNSLTLDDVFGPVLPSFFAIGDGSGGTEVIEALSRTADDFSQSGTSDILFRDDNSGDTGDTGLYVMSKGVFQHWDDIGPSSNAYAIVGTGDFRGNGGSNVLYEDLTHGDVGYYQISAAGSNLGWTDIGAASTAYTIVGTGDFFGTGQDEILFRNNTGVGDTGFYAITPSGTLAGWHDIGPSSTAYSIVGVGDFNGDGTSDVLYRSASTGDTGFYQVNNGHLTSWSDIGVTSTAYAVVGVGDFLGKGTEEALFRSNASGDTGFYTAGSTWHDLGVSSTAYQVVGIGNYQGDATSDILFRSTSAGGDTGFYQIENGAITTWHDIGATSTLYTVHT